MAKILVLDPSKEALDKCKFMLSGMEKEYHIIYTTYPEQAIEMLKDPELAVVITEENMNIINAREISDMIKIMHPEIVHLLITEVENPEDILKTLNTTEIFEVILKPYRFPEDIEEPLKRALMEYETRMQKYSHSELTKKHIHQLDMEYDRLKNINRKRAYDYSYLYEAFLGMARTYLEEYAKTEQFPEISYEHMKKFVENIVKEYIDISIFDDKDMNERKDVLYHKFYDETNNCDIHISLPEDVGISKNNAKDIYYILYLMGYLCKNILVQYHVKIDIELQQNVYLVKFICDIKQSILNGQIMYAENSETIRSFMHETVEVVMKNLYAKSMKGYQGNPFIAVATIMKDS